MLIFLALTGLPRDPALTELSDRELIKEYQAREDTRCILELLLRYEAYLTSIYVRMTPERELGVGEAVQELFILLCKKLKTVNPDQMQKVPSFMGFIVRNHLIDLIRRQKRHQDWESQQSFIPDWSMEKLGDRMDTAELMTQIRTMLSDKEWDCVDRFYLKHQSYKEIGEALGMSFNQVRGTLNRTLQRMREAFAQDSDSKEVPKR